MKRHYFISDNLSDLQSIEKELQNRGVTALQFHVLSQHDADVEHHKLHEVMALMKTDVVHSAVIGALVGLCAFLLTLAIAHTTGFAKTAGWIPFIFLALVLLGFCTWEGGLRGIQEPHYRFRSFQSALRNGQHVFFVDIDDTQNAALQQVVARYPALNGVRVEPSGPHWVIAWQQKCLNFIRTLP